MVSLFPTVSSCGIGLLSARGASASGPASADRAPRAKVRRRARTRAGLPPPRRAGPAPSARPAHNRRGRARSGAAPSLLRRRSWNMRRRRPNDRAPPPIPAMRSSVNLPLSGARPELTQVLLPLILHRNRCSDGGAGCAIESRSITPRTAELCGNNCTGPTNHLRSLFILLQQEARAWRLK